MSNPPSTAGSMSAAQEPQQVMRRKREPTMFNKNPSRPFQLQAMQKARGISPSSTTGSFTSSSKNASRSSQRVIPLSQSLRSFPSSASVSSVRASSSVGPSPSSSQAGSPAAAAPELPFQEFSIVSTDRHGWRYDVMKFDSRKPVDINVWSKPVKLNRKEFKRPETNVDSAAVPPVAVGQMLGPDGKPVLGMDGRVIMVDAAGKPIHDAPPSSSGSAPGKGKDDKDKDKNKKRKNQRKTREVHKVPDHIRQLRREERYPWMMEDASGSEIWEGRMEDANKSEMHGLLMPAPNNVFKFVPAHRWYKFQKKLPQKQHMTLEEVEKKMAERQKGKELGRWTQRMGGVNAPLAGGIGSTSLVYDIGGASLGPGGRRLRTVDHGMGALFGDDEDDDRARRQRARETGAEGDMDEMEYEEDFADDEEPAVNDGMDDEEAKELEERLKREYKSANKTREGFVDESDEEEEDALSGAGKDMKKLVKKIERNAAYDSDEEKNPYASSEDEEEEEAEQPPQPTGPAVQDQSNVKKSGVVVGSKPSPSAPQSGSRSGSPAPSGPVKVKTEASPPPLSMGGHSIVAKRATSPPFPKAPKLKSSQSGSRATSPLAGGGSGSRASSPSPTIMSPGASRAATPSAATPSKKRKAEDGSASPAVNVAVPSAAANGAQPKLKKRKPGAHAAPAPNGTAATAAPSSPAVSGLSLTAESLISVLKKNPNMTTRECIRTFQPVLTDQPKKLQFTDLVKEVAHLANGVLTLKPQYREGGDS